MSKISIKEKRGIITVTNKIAKSEIVDHSLVSALKSGSLPGLFPVEVNGKELEVKLGAAQLVPVEKYLGGASHSVYMYTIRRVLDTVKMCEASGIAAALDLQTDRVFADPSSGYVYCILWPVAGFDSAKPLGDFFKTIAKYGGASYEAKYMEHFAAAPFTTYSFETMLASFEAAAVPAVPAGMIACERCGCLNDESDKFCQDCGAPIIIVHAPEMPMVEASVDDDIIIEAPPAPKGMTACAVCGEFVPAGDKFCMNCGTPVPEAVVEETAEETYADIDETAEMFEEAEIVEPSAEPEMPAGMKACASCGELMPADDRFCMNCGALNEIEVEEPVIEEPVIEEPVIEEPVIEEPVVEEEAAEVEAPEQKTCDNCGKDVPAEFSFCPYCGCSMAKPETVMPTEPEADDEIIASVEIVDEVAEVAELVEENADAEETVEEAVEAVETVEETVELPEITVEPEPIVEKTIVETAEEVEETIEEAAETISEPVMEEIAEVVEESEAVEPEVTAEPETVEPEMPAEPELAEPETPADPEGAACKNCGALNPAESLFCQKCGTKLAAEEEKPAAPERIFCASCGKPNPVGSKFCQYCGNPFNLL